MKTEVIVDTNVMLAAMVPGFEDHARCAELLASLPRPVLVPILTIAEICHLLTSRLGKTEGARAELTFLQLIVDGDILPYYNGADWDHISELATKYLDNQLGAVDASVLITAEKNGTNRVASTDQLFYSVVTPRTRFWDLLP